MSDFKVRDVVQLRSCEWPRMTVHAIGLSGVVSTVWFDGDGCLKSGWFLPTTLVLLEERHER
jgi:uncharacterized protein YodC (DUF2158 family)